jgi:hypothetical protein
MARRIAKLGGVGHQPTGFDIFSIGVDGWQPVSPDQFDSSILPINSPEGLTATASSDQRSVF